jgi:hypothetical protein
MRTFATFVGLNLVALFVAGLAAQKPRPGTTSAAAPSIAVSPTATVQEIMATIIDPASKVVFEAVSTTESNGVEQKKEPRTDEQWAVVRTNAMMMIDGAKLITMPGRHIASAAESNKAGDGELTPAQIEARLAGDRASWNRLAREFGAAASSALKAVDARNADAVMESGEAIDTACENCHLRFWYPDQDKLFKK